MSFLMPGADAPVDAPCHYGQSRLGCRGPLRKPRPGYVAFVGGNETYGRFVADPFATLVERRLGRDCVNLGCPNAGPDAFLGDADIMALAAGSALTVLQVPEAQNMSNRYYRVHRRRNDRFLSAAPLLRSTYAEVDFTEFHFNTHLLLELQRRSQERFGPLRAELQRVWQARMRRLIRAIARPVMLLWLRRDLHRSGDGFGPETTLVTRAMLDGLEPLVADIVEIPVKSAIMADDMDGMVYGPLQAPIARHMIGPAGHRAIAERLLSALEPRP